MVILDACSDFRSLPFMNWCMKLSSVEIYLFAITSALGLSAQQDDLGSSCVFGLSSQHHHGWLWFWLAWTVGAIPGTIDRMEHPLFNTPVKIYQISSTCRVIIILLKPQVQVNFVKALFRPLWASKWSDDT